MTTREQLLVEALRTIVAQCKSPGSTSLSDVQRTAENALSGFNRGKRVANALRRMRGLERREQYLAEAPRCHAALTVITDQSVVASHPQPETLR